jgi:hypothetical protein
MRQISEKGYVCKEHCDESTFGFRNPNCDVELNSANKKNDLCNPNDEEKQVCQDAKTKNWKVLSGGEFKARRYLKRREMLNGAETEALEVQRYLKGGAETEALEVQRYLKGGAETEALEVQRYLKGGAEMEKPLDVKRYLKGGAEMEKPLDVTRYLKGGANRVNAAKQTALFRVLRADNKYASKTDAEIETLAKEVLETL